MLLIITICCLLVFSTTLLHYEALRLLNLKLPTIAIADRLKLVVVVLTTFVAHAAEIWLYGITLYLLLDWGGAGGLLGATKTTLESCMYFSAETYTSLGFGDLTPVGPVRLLAGVEALNGLLLIGWSASFAYISMERFWKNGQ
jgi:hypothetical protein